MKLSSIGAVIVAIAAGVATTAVCFGDALRAVPARAAVSEFAPSFSPPLGITMRPFDVLGAEKLSLIGARQMPSLKGKVVVVNFWTFSCINSIRALPFLSAWQAQYGKYGLVVVGVHTPEFRFERDAATVNRAARSLGVTFPSVQDNSFEIWRKFANEGWPSFYFVDGTGRVRGYRVGEGSYRQSEQLIRELLSERGNDMRSVPFARVTTDALGKQAVWNEIGSPETYLGEAKAIDFQSPGGFRRDPVSKYEQSQSLKLNEWDLSGFWTVGAEFAMTQRSHSRIRMRFHARDAHLVLGGPGDGTVRRFRVLLDGAAPGSDHGLDINSEGWGEVRDDRLYQLVRQRDKVRDRTITIEFERPGVRAYVFTFG